MAENKYVHDQTNDYDSEDHGVNHGQEEKTKPGCRDQTIDFNETKRQRTSTTPQRDTAKF